MKKIFIIDASGYLYSAYFAIRNMTNSKGESTNALFGFVRSTLKLIKDFNPTHLVAVFDGPNNAKKREEIFPEYKAHRSETPQDLPYQIEWAKELCTLMGIPYLDLADVEADDTMGTIAVWAAARNATSYLCTSDKDMSQLVNEHVFMLNTRKDNLISGVAEIEQTYGVSPSQMVDYLALVGDTSDNVPGVPGIGPKTASTLIKQFGSLENLLLNPEQIDGEKKRLLITQNSDKARLSKKLVTIDLSVPIPYTEDFYKLDRPNVTALKDFYLKMSFNSLVKELETSSSEAPTPSTQTPPSQTSYKLINDEESLRNLINELQKHKTICLYLETHAEVPHQTAFVGLSFSVNPHEAWYVPLNGSLPKQQVLQMLKPLLEDPSIGFYGYNIKAHYHVLAAHDIHLGTISFDVLLASYLLNAHHRQHSLEALALQYFGTLKMSMKDLLGKGKTVIAIQDVPLEKIYVCACESVDLAFRLAAILDIQIKERNLTKLMYDLELPLLRVLAEMEQKGIYLDTEHLSLMSQSIQQKIGVVEKEIYALAGEEFNINSPKQVSHILQDKLLIQLPKKTATGYSTNAEILEDLKYDYPIAQWLLEYRTLEKLRSTYLESLPLDVNPHTHRIHCTFNQSVAATGRLSCQDPNLQNIPVRTEEGRKIREAFKPQQQGWSYLAADYSQIELRLLAHLSSDPSLIQAFQNHEDIHTYTAAIVLGIPQNEVTKEQRYQAKAVNFGIIYGQQAFGLAKELKIDVKSASAFIDMYFKRYQQVKEFLEYCKDKARTTGKATTFIGRERLIPEINSRNGQLRLLAERLAVNTPVQGSAADLIKLAMLKLNSELAQRKLKGYMILQVHDELIFEVPDEEIDLFKPLVKEIMQNVFQLKVPLIVDISVGKNWKEC